MMFNIGGLGGDEGQDLNKGFGATTDQGKSLFTAPFGDRTTFRTKEKKIKIQASFTFDPEAPYDSTSSLASISTGYWAEIREALLKTLVPKEKRIPTKIAPKERTVLNHVVASLNKDTLTEYFKQDLTRLERYVQYLEDDAGLAWEQENAFNNALNTKEFRLRFDIGIDAFPNVPAKEMQRKPNDVSPGRHGVLSIFLEGIPDSDEGLEAKESLLSETEEEDPTLPPSDKLILQRHATELKQNRSKKNLKELGKLRKKLGLDDPEWTISASLFKTKNVDDVDELFDALEKWFNACLTIRTEKLQEDLDGQASRRLYQ